MNALDKAAVDAMLDKYNDYIALHNMFGDEQYKQKAEAVMTLMKNMYGKKEKFSLVIG